MKPAAADVWTGERMFVAGGEEAIKLLCEAFGEGFDGFGGGVVFDACEACEKFVVCLIIVVVGVAVGVDLV